MEEFVLEILSIIKSDQSIKKKKADGFRRHPLFYLKDSRQEINIDVYSFLNNQDIVIKDFTLQIASFLSVKTIQNCFALLGRFTIPCKTDNMQFSFLSLLFISPLPFG